MLSARVFQGEMIQDLPNDRRVFHTGDYAHRALTLLAGFDINVEYPFQALSPGHGGVAFGKTTVVIVTANLLPTLASSSRGNQHPIFAVRREYSMKSGQVDSRLRHQGIQSRHGPSCASLRPRHTVHPAHKIQWLENDMGSAVSEWCFEFITYLATRGQRQALA